MGDVCTTQPGRRTSGNLAKLEETSGDPATPSPDCTRADPGQKLGVLRGAHSFALASQILPLTGVVLLNPTTSGHSQHFTGDKTEH